MPAPENRTALAIGDATTLTESHWHSLQYFSLYRLAIAAVFVVAFHVAGGTGNLGSQDPRQFEIVGYFYIAAAYLFLFVLRRFKRAFDLQISIQVATDILVLTLLMYASGGANSGIAVMLMVTVAGAGLVGQGRLTLFYAALATLAVLFEQGYRLLRYSAEDQDFVRTGLLSIGFFATAITAQLLARRVVANERLARQRGIELTNQLRINQQVILEMQDGVLVLDATGRVRQHNPQAEVLLDAHPAQNSKLDAFSIALRELWDRLPEFQEELETTIRVPTSGRLLRARLLPPGEGGYALIYLEDISRAQAQAQQMKLAALGRLTANIAHEIRNPLAAISHAAELLREEQRAPTADRLTRIIGDNAHRLNRLVGEVLELGRRDRTHPEAVPLERFLRQLLEEYALHVPAAAQRVAIAATADAVACFDRAHLHRVVENLLTNALRYASQDAGAVRLETRVVSARRVELHIIDDGPGIEGSARGHVFEPFFTTHSGGTGLGLYIARELCEANGASLDLVDSARGAHFQIVAKGGECRPRNAGDATS